jgi:hypothetical protein
LVAMLLIMQLLLVAVAAVKTQVVAAAQAA